MTRKSSTLDTRTPMSPYVGEMVEAFPVADIRTDLRYQRPLDEGLIRKVIDGLDIRAFGVLLLALRPDNQLYVADGQHRHQVASRLGWETVPAVALLCETVEDEARLFVQSNNRSNMRAIDLHRANVTARDATARIVQYAVQAADLVIGERGRSDRGMSACVAAVSTLYTITANYGPDITTRSLIVLRDAWHGETYQAMWLRATAQLLATYEPDGSDDAKVIARLARKSVREIKDRATERAPANPHTEHILRAQIWAYNSGRGPKWNLDALDGDE